MRNECRNLVSGWMITGCECEYTAQSTQLTTHSTAQHNKSSVTSLNVCLALSVKIQSPCAQQALFHFYLYL